MRLSNPGAADSLHSQLIQDAGFLQSMGMVDYSLLIGVSRRQTQTQSQTQREGGACPTTSYEVAIIDTLTKFGSGVAAKKQCSNYAREFMRLVTSIVQ
jgi:hypothetical protein